MKTLAYIAGQLPKRSETFVYRELLGLRAAGFTVVAATLHPPERDLGEPRLDALAAEAVPVYGAGARRLALDCLAEWLTHPVRATATLWRAGGDAVAPGEPTPFVARLKIPAQALAALALARRLRARDVAHLHAHFAHAPATVAMYAARQLAIPFSFTGHAVDLFRDRALLKTKLRRAAAVNCISAWHRAFYHDLVPRAAADYPIVRCGVDPSDFAPTPHPPGAPPIVLGVGRLVPKKGFDLLIEATARLRDAGRVLRVCIAGDGPEAGRLVALRARLGLEQAVALPGAQPNAAVRARLRDADLFVLPCRVDTAGDRDGIPVVLMEAMATGVPVIAGDLPTLRELVRPGETGELTPPGDAGALAERIAALLDDPDRAARLARAGRAHVAAEFALDVNIQRLRNMLENHEGVAP